jgi:hypothetical protein
LIEAVTCFSISNARSYSCCTDGQLRFGAAMVGSCTG